MKIFVQTVVVPEYWEAAKGRGVRHLNDVLYAARCLVARELNDREYLTIALHDIGVGRAGYTRDEHPCAALAAIDAATPENNSQRCARQVLTFSRRWPGGWRKMAPTLLVG